MKQARTSSLASGKISYYASHAYSHTAWKRPENGGRLRPRKHPGTGDRGFDILGDEGVSGSTVERPGLQAALGKLT